MRYRNFVSVYKNMGSVSLCKDRNQNCLAGVEVAVVFNHSHEPNAWEGVRGV